MNRRHFLSFAAAEAVMWNAAGQTTSMTPIKAIAFDGFTTFDLRSIAARTEEIFPGKGTEFSNQWRTRQFEYSWLRTLTNTYADFWQVTEESLRFTAKMMKLDLTQEKRQALMQSFRELRAWPDSPSALKRMKAAGLKLVFLSNFTEKMLDDAVRSAGLEGIFEPHLSTDRVRAYKPDPRAYRMGVDALHLRREEIAFAAFGGWDAAGAKAFGYPTFWVNRLNLPAEELGVAPDGIGATLDDLADFVLGKRG